MCRYNTNTTNIRSNQNPHGPGPYRADPSHVYEKYKATENHAENRAIMTYTIDTVQVRLIYGQTENPHGLGS